MSEKTDYYLKTVRIRYWLIWLAVAIVVASGILWFFLGSYNITVSGYGQVFSDTRQVYAVRMEQVDALKPGMEIWVGNARGKIENINYDILINYSDLCEIYGKDIIDRTDIDENDVFYAFTATIPGISIGTHNYSVVAKTMTPYEYISGGTQK